MKYHNYTIVHANGDVERYKVPRFFDPYTVASRLPHSLVFMDIPQGHSTSGYQPEDSRWPTMIHGPAVVLVHKDCHYWMPYAPKDDVESGRLWRNYGPDIYKKTTAA